MFRIFFPAVFASSCAVVLAAGCTSESNHASGTGADGSTNQTTDAATMDAAQASDGGAPEAADKLSCLGVVRCVGNCPDDANANACADGCLAQTRPSSQTVTNGFATCLETEKCADAECIKARCGSELDACIADDAKDQDGTPLTPVSGSLPAELVGIWSSVGLSSGESFQFDADGKTTQTFTTNSSLAGCSSGVGVTSNGVTSGTADTLIYHRETGSQVITNCGSTSSSKPLEPKDLTYRYEVGIAESGDRQLTLRLVQEDGTLGYPSSLYMRK